MTNFLYQKQTTDKFNTILSLRLIDLSESYRILKLTNLPLESLPLQIFFTFKFKLNNVYVGLS